MQYFTATATLCIPLVVANCALSREPKSLPLEEAVRAFNEEAVKSPVGRKQPPVTADEILRAIREEIRSGKVSSEHKETLEGIERGREFPPSVALRRVTRYDDGEAFHVVWWVRLLLYPEIGPLKTVSIRNESLFSRPYTQMERSFKKEWGETTPLLNRLSAFFADDGQFGKETVVPDCRDELR